MELPAIIFVNGCLMFSTTSFEVTFMSNKYLVQFREMSITFKEANRKQLSNCIDYSLIHEPQILFDNSINGHGKPQIAISIALTVIIIREEHFTHLLKVAHNIQAIRQASLEHY